MVKSLCLFVSESMFILPLKDIVSEYGILDWYPFLFILLKIFNRLMTSIVRTDKLAISLSLFPRQYIFLLWLFL